MSNILLRKTDVLKTFRKRTFLGKKIWRNVLALKSKKVQDIFRKTFIFGIVVFILSSAVFCLQNCLRSLLICFARDIKGFYPSSLGNEVDSKDMSNVSPNILAKNWNFKKLRHGFVGESALITTALIKPVTRKPLYPFACERKDLKTHF